MEETWWTRWMGSSGVVRAVRLLAVAEAGLLVLLVFVSAARRLHYPFELDWIEAGTLTEVGRVLHGLPLYVAPTIRYTPYIYAPGFFWVSAAMAKVVGLGFPAMRLVSIGSTAGLFLVLFWFVWGESSRSSRWVAGSVGVGLFATAYWITLGFFDVGRVDMLCLMLLMAGLLLVRRGWLIAAGVVLAASVLVKQGVLPVAVLALCSEWPRPRRMSAGLASLGAVLGMVLGWLARVSGGWSTIFLFKVAAGFALDKRMMGLLLVHEILPAVLGSVAVIAATVVLVPVRARGWWFYGLTFVGMVPYTAYLRAHAGAAGNADLPAFLWVAFTAAVCVGRWMDRQPRAGTVTVLGVALLQMLIWTNGPALEVPTAPARELREALVARVRAMPGEVLVLDHAQYALAAGKQAFADGKAIDGLITSPRLGLGAELRKELGAEVDSGGFTAIVVDGSLEGALHDTRLPGEFERVYPVRAEVPVVDTMDQRTEPGWIFLKCGEEGLVRGLAVESSGCNRAGWR